MSAPTSGPRLRAQHLDLAVDLAIVALAAWTVLFQLALQVDLDRNATFGIWLLVTLLMVPLLTTPHDADPGTPGPALLDRGARILLLALGAVAVSLGVFDLTGRWWLLPWAAASALLLWGVVVVLRPGIGRNRDPADAKHSSSRAEPVPRAVAAVLILGLTMALLSLITQRPDEDDVFVVNRSTVIEQDAGPFPERDTLFSDEVFAIQRPTNPQTSIEALLGSVAAALPVSAPFVVYLIFAPLVSALGVFATWRLLRIFGARAPTVAVVVAAAFVVLDGASVASFGNFNFGRAWQGKVAFLTVVVPALWTYALLWGRAGRQRHLWLAAAAATAGVGLTSSSAFVVPPIVVIAVVAGALAARRPSRILAAALPLLPALIAGLTKLSSESQTPVVEPGTALGFVDLSSLIDSGIDPATLVYFVFDDGLPIVLGLGCALVAWLVVDRLDSQLALLGAPLAAFVGFWTPGGLDLLADITDADSVLWRAAWIMPVPAAVGLVLTQLPAVLGVRARQATVAFPVIVLAALAIWSTPVPSSSNSNAALVWPPAFDLPDGERAAAEALIAMLPDGGVAAAPQPVGYPLAVLSADVRAINPRSRYLLGGPPELLTDDRALVAFILEFGLGDTPTEEFTASLQRLDADVVCQYFGTGDELTSSISNAGFLPTGADGLCQFWIRAR